MGTMHSFSTDLVIRPRRDKEHIYASVFSVRQTAVWAGHHDGEFLNFMPCPGTICPLKGHWHEKSVPNKHIRECLRPSI
jgi:hypothetical protein